MSEEKSGLGPWCDHCSAQIISSLQFEIWMGRLELSSQTTAAYERGMPEQLDGDQSNPWTLEAYHWWQELEISTPVLAEE